LQEQFSSAGDLFLQKFLQLFLRLPSGFLTSVSARIPWGASMGLFLLASRRWTLRLLAHTFHAFMPELVFLPGAGGSAAFWRPVAAKLAELGPVHLFGWPGFGDVPADPGIHSLDDLFQWFLRRLPKGPSHVIAQSMGGILAVRLALEHPDRVASLVLVATSGGVNLRRFGAADWRPDYVSELPRVPRWFVKDRTDFTDRLGEIRVPTLLVWSDSDALSPLAVSHFLAERIPNAHEVTVSGGSHAFANERSVEVAALIRASVLGSRDQRDSAVPAQGN